MAQSDGVAVGISVNEIRPASTRSAASAGNPDEFALGALTQKPVPLFVKTVIGPDAEFELHGGRLRVLAADIYDMAIEIRWRVAPEPDIAAVFPSEIAQMVHDTEGTDDWAGGHLQSKGKDGLRMMRLYRFAFSDDVGTQYMRSSGGSGGGW